MVCLVLLGQLGRALFEGTHQGNGVSNHREHQLEDAVEGEKWKQALALCEKRIKKGEKDDIMMVTKGIISQCIYDDSNGQRSKQELDSLINREPPIADVAALLMLEHHCDIKTITTNEEIENPRFQNMWERAATSHSKDKSFYEIWFKRKFLALKWSASQKSAMKYQSNFPQSRKAFFWAIYACHFAGSDNKSPSQERDLYSRLAFNLLSRAASDAQAHNPKDMKNPKRALKKHEDILLLLQVYKLQGKFEEALSVLGNSRTMNGSTLTGCSWEVLRHEIELYELCERWDDLWRFCRQILNEAHPDRYTKICHLSRFGTQGDDWKVWTAFLTASSKIRTIENAEHTENLIQSYVLVNSANKSRNARLALVKYYSMEPISTVHEINQDNMLKTTCEYFQDYSTRLACFHDLQPYLIPLKTEQRESFLVQTATYVESIKPSVESSESVCIAWLISEINVLKLDYDLVVSNGETGELTPLLNAFVCNCLRLYQISQSLGSDLPISERHPGDDAGILAAMALFHVFLLGSKEALLRCATILEYVVDQSKHNYDALLLLIRIHLELGAASMAYKPYSRLKVKNMQYASLPWVFYSRISTIQPHGQITNPNKIDTPSNQMEMLRVWYESTKYTNEGNIIHILDQERHDILLDYMSFHRSITSNLSKIVMSLEVQQIQRFKGHAEKVPGHELRSMLDALMGDVEDIQDESAFPNCEGYGQKTFEELTRPAPKLGKRWAATRLRAELLWQIILENTTIPYDTLAKLTQIQQSTDKTDLTSAESQAEDLAYAIERAFLCNTSSSGIDDQNTQVELDYAITKIEDWHLVASHLFASENSPMQNAMALTSTLTAPDWPFFHICYLALEMCDLTIAACECMKRLNRATKLLNIGSRLSQLNKITELARGTTKMLQKAAMEQRNRLQAKSTAEELVEVVFKESEGKEDDIGRELKNLVGEEWMKTIAEDLRDSWIDNLEGILHTKPCWERIPQ